jgi:DUF1365 family protein
VTYHMNRLQAIAADVELCLTLNRTEAIDPSKIVRKVDYAHPMFMHVSPFMGMDQEYVFRAATPGKTLSVQIESTEGGRSAFDATLSLRRVELRDAGRVRPTPPAQVLAMIYGHAAALKLKGVPVHRRPEVGV